MRFFVVLVKSVKVDFDGGRRGGRVVGGCLGAPVAVRGAGRGGDGRSRGGGGASGGESASGAVHAGGDGVRAHVHFSGGLVEVLEGDHAGVLGASDDVLGGEVDEA